MVRHRPLTRNLGDNGRLARDQLIERLDDVHAVKFRPCRRAAPRLGQRTDDAYPARRIGRAQGGDHVLRHATAADQADRGHASITVGSAAFR
jgi:hypothetical protein